MISEILRNFARTRREIGMTYDELSRLSGVNRHTLLIWFGKDHRRRRNPTLENLVAVAQCLGHEIVDRRPS